MKKHNGHKSVMMRESIENMKLSKGSVVVDATLNGGGHASEILDIIAPDGVLIGIDKDSEALERSERRFADTVRFWFPRCVILSETAIRENILKYLKMYEMPSEKGTSPRVESFQVIHRPHTFCLTASK